MIALAMPCCFSVLLPSYFASSFKRKISLFSMTIIFASGIALVLLPIAFGASFLSEFIGVQHGTLFVLGGLIMIGLGVWTLWGRYMLPMFNAPVNLKRSDVPSVFTLGIFSGVASTCCAPVLAGIFVLTATVSASIFEAFGVGISYVFGMVFPLLIGALLWDTRSKSKVEKFTQGRMVTLKFLGIDFSVHSSKLVAGVIFIAMGAFTVALGWTDTMFTTPGIEWMGIYQTTLERNLANWLSSPFALIVLGISLAIASIAVIAVKRRGWPKARAKETHSEKLAESSDANQTKG